MPHVDVVPRLWVPWVKAGTLHIRAPASPAHSMIRRWCGGDRGTTPLSSLFSETRGGRGVKLNYHLTLGETQNLQAREKPVATSLSSFAWKANSFFLAVRSTSPRAYQGPQAGLIPVHANPMPRLLDPLPAPPSPRQAWGAGTRTPGAHPHSPTIPDPRLSTDSDFEKNSPNLSPRGRGGAGRS